MSEAKGPQTLFRLLKSARGGVDLASAGPLQALMKNIRQGGLLGGAVLLLFLLVIPLFFLARSSTKDLDAARSRYREIVQVGGQYLDLRDRFDAVERRKSAKKAGSVTEATDMVLSPLGIKGKMKALKVTGKKEIRDGHEESAEVRFEKMTMNEVVNVLYAIDHAPVTVSVKRVTMKKSFENPELLDVTMTLSLFL